MSIMTWHTLMSFPFIQSTGAKLSYLCTVEEIAELSAAMSVHAKAPPGDALTCASQMGRMSGFSQLTPYSNCSPCWSEAAAWESAHLELTPRTPISLSELFASSRRPLQSSARLSGTTTPSVRWSTSMACLAPGQAGGRRFPCSYTLTAG